MKKTVAFFAVFLIGTAMYAQWDTRYKSLLGVELSGTMVDGLGAVTFGLESTHGILIENRFFLGAGAGVSFAKTITKEAYFKDTQSTAAFPIYGNARLYLTDHPCRPYLDAKGGYVLGDADGSFFRPSLGFSVPVGKRCAINIGFSYQVMIQKATSLFESQRIKTHSFAFDWGLEF